MKFSRVCLFLLSGGLNKRAPNFSIPFCIYYKPVLSPYFLNIILLFHFFFQPAFKLFFLFFGALGCFFQFFIFQFYQFLNSIFEIFFSFLRGSSKTSSSRMLKIWPTFGPGSILAISITSFPSTASIFGERGSCFTFSTIKSRWRSL